MEKKNSKKWPTDQKKPLQFQVLLYYTVSKLNSVRKLPICLIFPNIRKRRTFFYFLKRFVLTPTVNQHFAFKLCFFWNSFLVLLNGKEHCCDIWKWHFLGIPRCTIHPVQASLMSKLGDDYQSNMHVKQESFYKDKARPKVNPILNYWPHTTE